MCSPGAQRAGACHRRQTAGARRPPVLMCCLFAAGKTLHQATMAASVPADAAEAFAQYDRNSSGAIEVDELKALLRECVGVGRRQCMGRLLCGGGCPHHITALLKATRKQHCGVAGDMQHTRAALPRRRRSVRSGVAQHMPSCDCPERTTAGDPGLQFHINVDVPLLTSHWHSKTLTAFVPFVAHLQATWGCCRARGLMRRMPLWRSRRVD